MGQCCCCCTRQLNGYTPISSNSTSLAVSHSSQSGVKSNVIVNTAARSNRSLRSKEQSVSESELLQTNEDIHPLPSEFLQLYILGSLVGVGTTSKVFKVLYRNRKKIFLGAVVYPESNTCSKNDGSNPIELACKIINKKKLRIDIDQMDIEALLKQLKKEVEILRQVSHPNIVTFVDFMETKDKLFIITEYLGGGELFDYIHKNGPLSEQNAKQLLFGVFSAVSYLHERGVIHRDIKAENVIFFKKPNGEFTLKLIDFGFSTIIKYALTGSFLGTGGYIAPEIRQSKHYSMSVDNWALGVLLYCTLSANLPFAVSIDLLPPTTAQCKSSFQLKFPEKKWSNISASVKDLIEQLLIIDPMKRFTAKQAVKHPWFRDQYMKQKNLFKSIRSSPNDELHHNALSTVTSEANIIGELPLLMSPLRSINSTLKLESKAQTLEEMINSIHSTPTRKAKENKNKTNNSNNNSYDNKIYNNHVNDSDYDNNRTDSEPISTKENSRSGWTDQITQNNLKISSTGTSQSSTKGIEMQSNSDNGNNDDYMFFSTSLSSSPPFQLQNILNNNSNNNNNNNDNNFRLQNRKKTSSNDNLLRHVTAKLNIKNRSNSHITSNDQKHLLSNIHLHDNEDYRGDLTIGIASSLPNFNYYEKLKNNNNNHNIQKTSSQHELDHILLSSQHSSYHSYDQNNYHNHNNYYNISHKNQNQIDDSNDNNIMYRIVHDNSVGDLLVSSKSDPIHRMKM
eukprot:gene7649-10410_t